MLSASIRRPAALSLSLIRETKRDAFLSLSQPRSYQRLAASPSLDSLADADASETALLTASIRLAMSRGELIPDPIMQCLVAARLNLRDAATRGFVLDGFPRTAGQAADLAASSEAPTVVVELSVSPETAALRMAERGRADDISPDSVTARLRAYEYEHGNVLEALRLGGARIVKVNADGRSVEQVGEDVRRAVNGDRKVCLTGMAGCGKSVQGQLLMRGGGPVHLSTGEILRQVCDDRGSFGAPELGLKSLV